VLFSYARVAKINLSYQTNSVHDLYYLDDGVYKGSMYGRVGMVYATVIAVPRVNTLEVDCDAQCVVTMYVYTIVFGG